MRFSGLFSFGAALCCAADWCLNKAAQTSVCLFICLSVVCLSVCLCAEASPRCLGVTKGSTDCFLFQWAAAGSGNILVVWRKNNFWDAREHQKHPGGAKIPLWLFPLIILSAVCRDLVFRGTPSSHRREHVALRFACWIKESSSAYRTWCSSAVLLSFLRPLTLLVFIWWPCCVRLLCCIQHVLNSEFRNMSEFISTKWLWIQISSLKTQEHWCNQCGTEMAECVFLWGSSDLVLCHSPVFIQPPAPDGPHGMCKVKDSNIKAS